MYMYIFIPAGADAQQVSAPQPGHAPGLGPPDGQRICNIMMSILLIIV